MNKEVKLRLLSPLQNVEGKERTKQIKGEKEKWCRYARYEQWRTK